MLNPELALTIPYTKGEESLERILSAAYRGIESRRAIVTRAHQGFKPPWIVAETSLSDFLKPVLVEKQAR